MSTSASVDQARVLRALAEHLEHGGKSLSPQFEEALVRELEDRADLEALRAAREEPGALPWETVKRDLDE